MKGVLAARDAQPAEALDGGAGWPLAEPFRIAGVAMPNRVVQAPLAGIANWAFRRQSRRHGAGLCVSEMVASYGVHHGNRRTVAMLRVLPGEAPMAIQLFGADRAVMAEAARAVEAAGADLIDVNMGCPVPKITKTGAGAALLDDPDGAAGIVEAMARAVDIPVMAKMRRGTTPSRARPVDVALRLEAAGAAALCVHPRAAAEEYSGAADHAVTAQVAAAVSIPVIASGDIGTPGEALRVVEGAGAAAVAIGRAALGNPWAFGEIASGRLRPRPELAEVVDEIECFAAEVVEALGPDRAVGYMRRFYPWYLAGQPVDDGALRRMQREPTVEGAVAILHRPRAAAPVPA